MAFDSVTFLIFFGVFFTVYWLASGRRVLQNALILAASYVFYGWWDYRFLGLIVASTVTDYVVGRMLDATQEPARRRRLVTISVVVNLTILGFFKYFDFFSQSLGELLAAMGIEAHPITLRVILPVGISFYTFQSMAYTIDVYRGHHRAERDLLSFFSFIAFFPQLVAGPIERAGHLLGQFARPRTLSREYLREGMWLVVYGMFLKVVVSNSVAQIADVSFRPDQDQGWMVILGTLAFSTQIYTDFLAYSTIARGVGRLLGFDIRWNFNLPYFATSFQDFWRRWHMSLSEWLRDYLYIPLGGNRRGRARTYFNLMATMTLGGLWHGAAWTFVAWGVLHGTFLCLERATAGRLQWLRSIPGSGWLVTMAVVSFGWFLFRCDSFEMMLTMSSALSDMSWRPEYGATLFTIAVLVAPVAIHEAIQYRSDDPLVALRLGRLSFNLLAGILIAVTAAAFGRYDEAFIYFQF